MRKAFEIALLNLRILIKDKTALFMMIAIPLFMTMIMGLVWGGMGEDKLLIIVVDEDKSNYSSMFTDVLKEDEVLSVRKDDRKNAIDEVRESKVVSAIIIPKNFGDKIKRGGGAKLKVVKLETSTRAFVVLEVVRSAINRIATNYYTANMSIDYLNKIGTTTDSKEESLWKKIFTGADGNWKPNPPVKVIFENVVASEVRGKKTIASGFSQGSLGFAVTFIGFSLVGNSATIMEDKIKRTLFRLLSTPTHKSSYIIGKILGSISIGIIQCTILILAGRYLFGVRWGRDPLGLILLMGSYIICVTSIGIMLASLVKTVDQAHAISPVIMISMSMLGGCYWPIEVVPQYMQTVARFTPTGLTMKGLTDIIVRGLGFQTVIIPSFTLLGMSLIFFTLGIYFLRLE
jgi:ABC-2 type transport system permease protein